jgi:hypothetical protein
MSNEPTRVAVWGGAASLVDTIPEGWYRRREAAQKVGRDYDTLRRWHKDGTYAPSGFVERGKLTVWVYSDDDIAEMKRIADNKKPGPSPQESLEDTDDTGSED